MTEQPLSTVRYVIQRQNARKTRDWVDVGPPFATATGAIEEAKARYHLQNQPLRVVRLTTETLWRDEE